MKTPLKLYLITPKPSWPGNGAYDVFDSAIVAARSPKDATKIHPNDDAIYDAGADGAFGKASTAWVKHPIDVDGVHGRAGRAGRDHRDGYWDSFVSSEEVWRS